MAQRPRRIDPKQALTLAEWEALDPTGNGLGPTRPHINDEIGSTSTQTRQQRAWLSELVTDRDPWQLAGRSNPQVVDIAAKDRARAVRRRDARRAAANATPPKDAA